MVILKVDGLPNDVVDRLVSEKDPRTGKSQLPWFDYIFYQRGARLKNFYVRGLSLSAPSWSLIDTGQHLQIKGNVEFDRYTLHNYDYLNFFPYVLGSAFGDRVDMPGVEVLDSLRIPILMDAFPPDERYVGFSLYQRGPRFTTFPDALKNRMKKAPKDLFDEWIMGFGVVDIIPQQTVRELIKNIDDPKVRCLDLLTGFFDHMAHSNNDHDSQLYALKEIDAMLGQIWVATQKSPLAGETALIVASDHGINSTEGIYSQGYNLVKFLGSSMGGGHHVITKRRLLLNWSIKGINPYWPVITTTTPDSYYLKGQSSDYPTAILDFDGNERASLHLRDSDLNLLHILWQQLQRRDLSGQMRQALTDSLFKTLDARRSSWQETLDGLNDELGAIKRSIISQRKLWEAQPKKFTKEDLKRGRDHEAKRVKAQLNRWISAEEEYGKYALTLTNLLALRRETFNPGNTRIEDVIARRAMGEHNSVYELQNYVAGIAPGGLALDPNGVLDLQKSFVRINYLSTLKSLVVRNNVQAGISNQPIDLIGLRLSADLVKPLLPDEQLLSEVIWIYGGADRQALILARSDAQGQLSFRYQPIRDLTQDARGRVHFETVSWQAGLPLQMFEDPQLAIPSAERAAWLSGWHTDVDWLRATHRAHYSNAVVGLYEELARHPNDYLPEGAFADERLMQRFSTRQRELVETDLLILANDHWNFDARGFNPGGNHGSFFRISTHSTFMIAGGDKTNLPRATAIEEPYDSLSFLPTILALTGDLRDDSSPVSFLWNKGFRRFPGRVVNEILPAKREHQKTADTGSALP